MFCAFCNLRMLMLNAHDNTGSQLIVFPCRQRPLAIPPSLISEQQPGSSGCWVKCAMSRHRTREGCSCSSLYCLLTTTSPVAVSGRVLFTMQSSRGTSDSDQKSFGNVSSCLLNVMSSFIQWKEESFINLIYLFDDFFCKNWVKRCEHIMKRSHLTLIHHQ